MRKFFRLASFCKTIFAQSCMGLFTWLISFVPQAQPPVVLTICIDGKEHEFSDDARPDLSTCKRCAKTKLQAMTTDIDNCRQGLHSMVPQNPPPDPTYAGNTDAKLWPIMKCRRCGMRQRVETFEARWFDDQFMHGGIALRCGGGGELKTYGIYGAAAVAQSDI